MIALVLLILLAMGALSVWRLTHMYQEEVGPGAIFEKLRAKVDRMSDKDGGFREGFFCFKCMSVWHAVILTVLLFTLPLVYIIIVVPLSLSTLAIFINDWKTKNE